jgi:hypothetical protein
VTEGAARFGVPILAIQYWESIIGVAPEHAAQLNTESSAMGSVVASRQIVDLPLNGRDYLQRRAAFARGGIGGHRNQGEQFAGRCAQRRNAIGRRAAARV